MAKRRRSRAGSAKPESSARSTGRGPKHTSPASQIPTERQIPRGVAAARAKHANDHNIEGSVVHPTLADRFYALPGELRNHIFALILVRPVKWQLDHHLSCGLRTTNNDNIYYPRIPEGTNDCTHCASWFPSPTWRYHQPSGTNPWRSKWAPPVRNEYVCSDCWDEDLRPGVEPCPSLTRLKDQLRCLCARRQGLESLLVCRRWYDEAGRVFWSRNCFAFEDSRTFVDFVSNLDPRWRDVITRVSIVAHFPRYLDPDFPPETISSGWEASKQIAPMWQTLRQLSSLSSLELDAVLLTRTSTVRRMLRLGLQNLRQARFVLRDPKDTFTTTHGNDHIWPEHHDPSLLCGGFAEEVARGIKGQRRRWLKRSGAIEWAVDREVAYQKSITESMHTARDENGVVGCDDIEEWNRLSWQNDHNSHAYLPSLRYTVKEGHCRDSVNTGWRSMSWEDVAWLNEIDVDVVNPEELFLDNIAEDHHVLVAEDYWW